MNLMRQIAKGIAFLHQNNIVHRDIKPGNILLKSCNGYAVVKLGDFGLSKFLDPDDMTSAMSSNVGTLTFKAPEFWDRQPDERVRYHRNIDVYAAGLTFTAMLQAKPDHSLVPPPKKIWNFLWRLTLCGGFECGEYRWLPRGHRCVHYFN